MSVYYIKGKGWRYDFVLNGVRGLLAYLQDARAAPGTISKTEEADEEPVQEG